MLLITPHHMNQMHEIDSNTMQIWLMMLSTILQYSDHYTSSEEDTAKLNDNVVYHITSCQSRRDQDVGTPKLNWNAVNRTASRMVDS